MNKTEFIKSKICKNFDDVKFSRMLAYWRFKDEKIVFVFGDFDILHYGNVRFLNEAAEYGTVLIVAVNSENETLHNAYEKAFNVASQHYVDYVVYYKQSALKDLIAKIKPNYLVHSSQQNIDELKPFLEELDVITKVFTCPEGFSNAEFQEKLKNFLK